MVPRIFEGGKSFAGLAAYLTHDPKRAETSERVAWTHTFNLANDHVPSAVDEMLWTYRAADLLKEEAGVRAGGRSNESQSKHFSLNWDPGENPSREHMVQTTEAFLTHMGWDEFQTLLVCHTDKHPHVHGMINTVHPVTGLKLNDDFERRKASTWAKGYELENGIKCENRFVNSDDRELSPTRPAWMAFKESEREFNAAENTLRADAANENIPGEAASDDPHAAEWKILREFQRAQRDYFFEQGREEFRELRREVLSEVRREFTPRWAEYYAAADHAGDPGAFAHIKASILADQKQELELRRDEACTDLRADRAGVYREMLDRQAETRRSLGWRQEAGLTSEQFLYEHCSIPIEQNRTQDVRFLFGRAASEVTGTEAPDRKGKVWEQPLSVGTGRDDRAGARSEISMVEGVGVGLGMSLVSLAESLVDGFLGAVPDPKPAPPPEQKLPDLFDVAATETAREQAIRDRSEAERRYYEEQQARSPH